MFLFIVADTPDHFIKSSLDLDEKHKDYSQYFEYIYRLCPQRSQKQIYYNQLLSSLRKKFHLDEESIKKILTFFIDNNALIVAFDDSVNINILTNTIRKKIYELIQKYPGIYSKIVMEYLSLGTRQTLWHITFLLEFNLIHYIRFNKIKAYSLKEVDLKRITIGYVILKDSLRNLLTHLLLHPNGQKLNDIANSLSKPVNSIFYSIRKLKKIGILTNFSSEKKKYIIDSSFTYLISQTIEKYKSIFSKP